MLSDPERKLLRILVNFSALHKRMPTIEELLRKTGRKTNGIIEALEGLERERYIQWERHLPSTIVILEGWERKPITQPLTYKRPD